MDLEKPTIICRVCLIQTKSGEFYQSIFDKDEEDIEIASKLNVCGGISVIEDDGKPDCICRNCSEVLLLAYNFRIICQNSDKKLNSIKTEDIKAENDLIIKTEPLNANTFEMEQIFTISSLTDSTASRIELDNQSRESTPEERRVNKPKTRRQRKARIQQYSEDKNSIPDEDIEIKTSKSKPEKSKRKTRIKKENDEQDTENKEKKNRVKKPKSEEKYPCVFCGITYSEKNSLKYHMRKHTNEMDYVCEVCGTAFETNFKLKRHIMTHTGEKPYACRFCDKTFLHGSNRRVHEMRNHTHIKPFSCEFCGKCFHTSGQIVKHRRVHTGEKPYICEKCGTGFKAKNHLKAHENSLVPCVVKMNIKNQKLQQQNNNQVQHVQQLQQHAQIQIATPIHSPPPPLQHVHHTEIQSPNHIQIQNVNAQQSNMTQSI